MTFVSIIGLITLAMIIVLGLLIKWRTGKKVDDLEGFGGIVNPDKVEGEDPSYDDD